MLHQTASTRPGVARRAQCSSAPALSVLGHAQRRALLATRAAPKDGEGASSSGRGGPTDPEVGLGLKAVWYGAEQFGKLLAMGRGQAAAAAPAAASAPRMSREAMMEAIRADYDENYFVTGAGDLAAYAPDCVFADPFVSFSGTGRFKQNVSNLGGLMDEIKIDVYEWKEGPNTLETKWRFSALLDLPWRPRLAAAGGTTHVFDLERGQVVRHEERWDVEPAKVVAQLFQPAAKVPRNAWETFFLAASAGDAKGVWWSLSPTVLKLSAVGGAGSLVWGLASGEGPGALGGVCGALVVSCLVTEVLKFAQGMQGGDTGTGGRF
ncbi:hypothetical protein HYH03_013968 [Edaphochlamys debaryana]|uniref:Uncharacterized protein n=1 Tax=Edaphochlamys debaryana TaxID=47281 RepID=A0A835XX91_9CHLO|nr:hypothetical protein HYH03_013968 [Edaphochlamys debaryana]|eukprot:KAG2487399.1 hypothetical protein HYH03_013968 [Edaphochlamys debaryana]